jgi:hypothetical protein
MIYLSLLLLCIIFIELFILLDLNSNIKSVFVRSKDAYNVVISTKLNDDVKEKSVRQSSLAIFKDTVIFLVKLILVIFILYIIYILLLSLFSLSKDQMIAASFSLYTIIILTVASLIYSWIRSVIIKRLQIR